jgi:hypothetical protein
VTTAGKLSGYSEPAQTTIGALNFCVGNRLLVMGSLSYNSHFSFGLALDVRKNIVLLNRILPDQALSVLRLPR